MTTRIRTLKFLPEVFQTSTNAQFLGATLDQIVDQPVTTQIQGYIGSKFGYGINAKDKYVIEPTKVRTDYQLDPGVVFTKSNTSQAVDFITYPGLIDAIEYNGGITSDNSRLFDSQIYSWDPFVDLDKIINFNQYYWLPEGAPAVNVQTDLIYTSANYIVKNLTNAYEISSETNPVGTPDPVITLIRGGTYTFLVDQNSSFWIQGEPGLTGADPLQPNVQTRDVLGVTNNGIERGLVTFNVPYKDAQAEYNLPGNILVDVVATVPFNEINGQPISTVVDIDGVTSLDGLQVMFYGQNPGVDGNPAGITATTYSISLVGLIDPIVTLTPYIPLANNEKITVNYGTQWKSRNFFRNAQGTITIIPYISSLLDTLYYQDGSIASKVGVIKLIDSNQSNQIDVATEILGKATYTSPNGVVFSNGLKVTFSGDVLPRSYLDGEYFVQGVGTAISLINTENLIVPELFTAGAYSPWDVLDYDIGNWDSTLFVPITQDYVTIARDSLDKNPWSRSNRWFHIDIINATASYLSDPTIATRYATKDNKAKRPIIEFYPNLKLFNNCSIGKQPVDFFDTRTTDAFSQVSGKPVYYPDVQVYTEYTATIDGSPSTAPGEFLVDQQYSIDFIGTTDFTALGASNVGAGSFIVGEQYIISEVGTTNFTVIGASSSTVGVIFTATGEGSGSGTAYQTAFTATTTGVVTAGNFVVGKSYTIASVGSTDFVAIGAASNDVGVTFTATGVGSGTGTATQGSGTAIAQSYTTLTVPASDVNGTFLVGEYISDSESVLPRNSTILSIDGTTTLTLVIQWAFATTITQTDNVSVIANQISNEDYAVYDGARIVFSADTNPEVKNKIYVVRFSAISFGSTPVITLTEVENGLVLPDEGVFAYKGYYNQGNDFYFTGLEWIEAQQKTRVNQPPLFDVVDKDNISFGDKTVYVGSSFAGDKLFSYGIGTGANDTVLGFPIRYSSVSNVGDVSFDVTFNNSDFTYLKNANPVTAPVNSGYVVNITRAGTSFAIEKLLGWQTSVAESRQYQILTFDFDPTNPTTVFVCDVAASTNTTWPNVRLFVNNVLQPTDSYTFDIGTDTTTITFTVPDETVETVIEVAILSDQVSKQGYYQIPVNLSNNPFNQDITTVNIGDIRGQYQSIFYNNPNTTGQVFGSNNYRDLGNLVPWGDRIIQNSASLVLPGAFLRKSDNNLIDSLQYNSQQYITFKNVLVNVVTNTAYATAQTPASMLDDALDQITSTKTDTGPFFWSDMLPSKAAYVTNQYTFVNALDTSVYPLSRIYDFSKANYYGVLIYVTRNSTVTQLISGRDYIISPDAPSVTVSYDLLQNDTVTIKEYNQTFGSYVPNTPTKLGMYPAWVPHVELDENYMQPTYFIVGHDGSYNRLYGSYSNGQLSDTRDQVLLEFETRIYNNLKLSNVIPLRDYDVIPGYFRNTAYSYDEILKIYSQFFLNWAGQNRVEYKPQLYLANNQFTYNYSKSSNKLDKSPILQGFWRGIYQYMYDTSTPDTSPWEMIGLTTQPTWWTTRYGPAPYTSDNLVLWGDLAEGINWNNGNPFVTEAYIRPQLLQVIPVDSNGDLLSPFMNVVGNYAQTTFKQDWKVGDVGPAEFSYRRSSSWPFDLMKILSLTQPANFFNLNVDIDNYKYNTEFNQFLVNDRSHLVISDIEIYGSGTAKTSYINWVVDYQKQYGIDATTLIKELLFNTDVRLIYRLAGFSDKALLNFYVEKGTPNSSNASLLIPSESYGILLYDNVPFTQIMFSGVIVQSTNNGWKVYGNSQTDAFFVTTKPKINGNNSSITVEKLSVKIAKDYWINETIIVPYGTTFYNTQDLAQFLSSYGTYLETQGVVFDQIESGLDVNWSQMIAEFLYWVQSGWEVGSIVNLNPGANIISINKDSYVVQPLTLQKQNYILNQNLYPIQSVDLSVVRDGTLFTAKPLNQGDTVAYGQFNISNFEHGVVFDNVTLFNDTLYNLVTGLRQNRILLRGVKTAEWNGTVDAQGFILNQDNIQEWSPITKYTKGSIVLFKNKYWFALKVVDPSVTFQSQYWKETSYDEIQKGLLPNASTRSYESGLFYNTNKSNLDRDADLLSWSLIGYRPRDYLALADLTDITQVNVYKNMIKSKGTRIAATAFKNLELPQGGIDYDIYENWAIKTGEFGGVLNDNFVDIRLFQNLLTGNPAIVSLSNGEPVVGSEQETQLYSLFNYGRPITDPNILVTIPTDEDKSLLPDAGYVNFNDVKTYAYYFDGLNTADTPISKLYVGEYVWVANYQGTWNVFAPTSVGAVIQVINNLNDTVTVQFATPHNLSKYEPLAIVNFNTEVDGYRIVRSIVDPYRITLGLTLPASVVTLTGLGVGLRFDSQRIATPAEINSLDLNDTEFAVTRIWVDENNDGGWAVLQKSLNYTNGKTFTDGTVGTPHAFGNAVAYSDSLGYLIADSTLGNVYRFVYNPLYNTYLPQNMNPDYDPVTNPNAPQWTLHHEVSFGTTITYVDDIFVISEPTSAVPKVYVYQLVITNLVNELQLVQSISVPDSTAGTFIVGLTYYITSLGDTNWNTVAGTSGITYAVGDSLVAAVAGSGTGTATLIANWGKALSLSQDKLWLYVSAFDQNLVYVFRKSQVTNEYEYCNTITTDGLVAGDNYGYSIDTNYYGDCVFIGAPDKASSTSVSTYGSVYAVNRLVQNYTTLYSSATYAPVRINLVFEPRTTTITVTQASDNVTPNNIFVCSSTAGLEEGAIGTPLVFSKPTVSAGDFIVGQTYTISYVGTTNFTLIGATSNTVGTTFTATGAGSGTGTALAALFGGIYIDEVYYVKEILSATEITLSLVRDGTVITPSYGVGTMSLTAQVEPLFVSVNGTLIEDDSYAVIGTTLSVFGTITVGSTIQISSSQFVQVQEFVSNVPPTISQFGYSVGCDTYGTEWLIGAPLEISSGHQGVIYRYTDGGAKYGIVIGNTACNLTAATTILINGFAVSLVPGDATTVAASINSALVPNISASATNGILTIYVNNSMVAYVNNMLKISVLQQAVLTQLGINLFTNTQVIECPHLEGRTQFGYAVKFNEFDSFVASAPAGSRFAETTFDTTDDADYTNDTLFDNNATQFIDQSVNAGAAYVFEYLGVYNESLLNPGLFVFAQDVNSLAQEYGDQPYYGTALDFNDNVVVIGTPGMLPTTVGGNVTTYINLLGVTNWSTFRQSSPVVDVNMIQNAQLYSAITNNTLVNLDYIDPLQGKILGVVRQNIDVVSNVDPASYNSPETTNNGKIIWGSSQVGKLWFDTTSVKFVNYHQNDDTVYNSKWWGKVFPGSQVQIYSWITSNTLPIDYVGPGTPRNITDYVVESVQNATGAIVPVYFYWVRNTNIVFNKAGKTLSDRICEAYITQPQATGISYMAPVQPNVFALYNCGEYIALTDAVLHVGFSTGLSNDEAHSVYSLIRANYADDFLPGLPGVGGALVPESLYNRMLESMAGVDNSGNTVPDPFLPKAVQSGILVRPRQSFFYNRFNALKNYLEYANEILLQVPIIETTEVTFIFTKGAVNPSTDPATNSDPSSPSYSPTYTGPEQLFFNTEDYWEYVNWWATGYSDATKSAMLVQSYYDLAYINATEGLIVTVNKNGAGVQETYIYTLGNWVRIGLQYGTIQFKSSLWDYGAASLGFGNNFFDAVPFDTYPSEETRYIVRAINEQLPSDLLLYRNKALILMFQYIISETIESQNYVPWLNKTSFIDVTHTIRELLPLEVFQSDNQEFLEGYLNEVKPYHVVIKDFLFEYVGTDIYESNITDFDVPATFNNSYLQYISPQLVYSTVNNVNQYLPENPIWQTTPYSQWFNNYGLSLIGTNDFYISTLESYVPLNANSMVVTSVYGFPINGVITIGTEQIGYSTVDLATNTISGLTRGVNGTDVQTHIPGENIFIDLSPVIVLDGGRGYTEPPKISAYIDTAIYPEPRRPAILKPIMNLDALLRIDVIDPGEGYVVTPEIRIDPSIVTSFPSSSINLVESTASLSNQLLQTGDLVQYSVGEDSSAIGGLDDGQYYYINVLQTSPLYVIAFYTTYADCIQNTNRVVFFDVGSGNNQTISVNARAVAIASSNVVRENQVTLRFDRTTYQSRLVDWQPAGYYGSFFAGLYNNSTDISSSAIKLYSDGNNNQTPISEVLASSQGIAFEIQNVVNDRIINWASRNRIVLSTSGTNYSVELGPDTNGLLETAFLGPTTGFYINMPIKFVGAAFGTLTVDTTYYVAYIFDLTSIAISTESQVTTDGNFTVGQEYIITSLGDSDWNTIANTTGQVYEVGNIIEANTTGTVGGTGTAYSIVAQTSNVALSAGLSAFPGEVSDTAIVTINYPGILTVTNTTELYNTVTVPLTTTGMGGTTGFYRGLPVFFTGDTFGNIMENDIYYVLSVLDSQTFTMAKTNDPIVLTVYSSTSSTLVVELTDELNINDAFVLNDIVINGVPDTSFAGLDAGTIYFVQSIPSATSITVCEYINGPAISLTAVSTPYTQAKLVSQSNAVELKTASGSVTMNVGLPISPGQITGQYFTMYNTSSEISNGSSGIEGTVSGLYTRTVVAAQDTRLYIDLVSGGVTNVYDSFPFRMLSNYAGLNTTTTYFVTSSDYTTQEVTATSTASKTLTVSSTEGFYLNMRVEFSGAVFGGVDSNTTYFVRGVEAGNFSIGDTYTIMTVGTTDFTTIGASSNTVGVTFTATGIGSGTGTAIGETTFTLAETQNGAAMTVSSDTGEMTVTSLYPYVTLSTTIAGTDVSLDPETSETTLTQHVTGTPSFFVSYVLGGYTVAIKNNGSGFAYNNIITIDGADLGGASGVNDLYITVDKVSTNAYSASSTGDKLYLTSISSLNVNQEFVLGDIIIGGSSGLSFGGLTPNTKYYIQSIDATDGSITVSTSLGGPAISLSDENTPNSYTVLELIGSITKTINSGTPVGTSVGYYLKVISETQLAVYSNSTLTVPVSGIDFPFTGVTSTSVTDSSDSADTITIADSTNFAINDIVVFTGNVSGGLVLGQQYYIITDIVPGVTTDIQVSTTPRGDAVAITQDNMTFTMAKYGDFAFLSEPFFFQQSIVKYQNKVWQCVVSNNDNEFILGKWELLSSDDRKLNELDRIIGYYQPTVNMPGLDISQLITGTTYPNGTYIDNAFAPTDEYSYDTYLQDQSFTPTNVNAVGISWNGTRYIGVVNSSLNTSIISSPDDLQWELIPLANNPVNATSIHYANGVYVITANNNATPIYVSTNGVVYTTGTNVRVPGFSVYVEATTLTSAAFFDGVWAAVGKNIVVSSDAYNWYEAYAEVTDETLNDIASVNIPAFTGFIVVGYASSVNYTGSFVLLSLDDGVTWNRVTPISFTVHSLQAIASSETVIAIFGNDGDVFTSPNGSNWITRTSGVSTDLFDAIYGDGKFIAVGAAGTIIRSTDNGVTWTDVSYSTTSNLNSVTYDYTNGDWVIVGDDNLTLSSEDGGVTWTPISIYAQVPTVYTIQGDEFIAGYGPEELVPGIVTDNLVMTVNTRPGSNWNANQYGHSGFSVNSYELTPALNQVSFQLTTVYVAPMDLSVYKVNASTGLGVRTFDFTLDCVNKILTLNNPLSVGEFLRVDCYEPGNGDQLDRSSSDFTPMIQNPNNGLTEIELSCYYIAAVNTGSGVIRPSSDPTQFTALNTSASSNTILCDFTNYFSLNCPIVFSGTVFGGIVEGTRYYVKTISITSISISETLVNGIAGPTFSLTDGTGSMGISLQVGTGLPWSAPIVTHNRNVLLLGEEIIVSSAESATDTFVTLTTSGLEVGEPIVFGSNAIGGVTPFTVYYVKEIISPQTFTISDINGVVIPLTDDTGSATAITNDYAISQVVDSSYAKLVFAEVYSESTDYVSYAVFGQTDYPQLGYSLPVVQIIEGNDPDIGDVDGTNDTFKLVNFTGGQNPENAIVDIDGIRVMTYTIDFDTETIVFDSPPLSDSVISVTTYNLTDNQYLNTQDGITGLQFNSIISISNNISPPIATTTVTKVNSGTNILEANNTVNFLAGATAQFYGTEVDAGSFVIGKVYTITTVGTTDFTLVGASSNKVGTVFTATGAGTGNGKAAQGLANIAPGVVYYIRGVDAGNFTVSGNYTIASLGNTDWNSIGYLGTPVIGGTFTATGAGTGTGTAIGETEFTLSTTFDGPALVISSTVTGSIVVNVGGQPAVRVTTALANGFETNDIVRIAGTSGSTQLNDSIYYVHVIGDPSSSTQFDLYQVESGYEGYNPSAFASNLPVTAITAYSSGGFAWIDQSLVIYSHLTSNTVASNNTIVVTGSTEGLIEGTPVYFNGVGYILTQPTESNIVIGQRYFIKTVVSGTEFTISETYDGETFVLADATIGLTVSQWEQSDVDRLWVSVNGERVASSSLNLTANNDLGILSTVGTGDVITITSMIPTATPGQLRYIQIVNKSNNASVYRANPYTTSVLVDSLEYTSANIVVSDVSRLVTISSQTATAPAAVNGVITVGLSANKNEISQVNILNNDTGQTLPSGSYTVGIVGTVPVVNITSGVTAGDSLTLTIVLGNLVYIDGEMIRFSQVDLNTNTLSGLTRGVNGTSPRAFIPELTIVTGISTANMLDSEYYALTWNNSLADSYNTVLGDPLQISTTQAAIFLNTGTS